MMYNESYDTSEVLDRNMYNNYIIYSTGFYYTFYMDVTVLKKTNWVKK